MGVHAVVHDHAVLPLSLGGPQQIIPLICPRSQQAGDRRDHTMVLRRWTLASPSTVFTLLCLRL